jgi:hypothetical protein
MPRKAIHIGAVENSRVIHTSRIHMGTPNAITEKDMKLRLIRSHRPNLTIAEFEVGIVNAT